jgi:hypothetical protein
MNYILISKVRVQEGRIRGNTSTQPRRKAESILENSWLGSTNKKSMNLRNFVNTEQSSTTNNRCPECHAIEMHQNWAKGKSGLSICFTKFHAIRRMVK